MSTCVIYSESEVTACAKAFLEDMVNSVLLSIVSQQISAASPMGPADVSEKKSSHTQWRLWIYEATAACSGRVG